jgi:hypothetical protein
MEITTQNFLKLFGFSLQSRHTMHHQNRFSLMLVEWTKDRSNLNIESVKGILLVQHNYKHSSGKKSHGYFHNNQQLLTKTQCTERYAWAGQESGFP